ncbi:MAG: hypothetical protein KJ047_00010 [Anaerolineae bacterium]|nr:hypothetical protein [Anaerolineae bacterium]
MKNGEEIEKKAWQVLSTGSTIFAVVSVLQANALKDGDAPLLFWIVLIIVLGLYLSMAFHVLRVIRPIVHTTAGSVPGETMSYPDWRARYVESDEEDYLEQMILNYAGDDDVSGVIQDEEAINQTKAATLQRAIWFLVTTICGLVGLAIAAAVG